MHIRNVYTGDRKMTSEEEIIQFKQKRAWCMFAAMVACICIGFTYAWSVIQTPIILAHGWEESKVALAYTAINLCSNFGAVIFGSLIKKMSVRQCIMTGALLFGGGILITGIITQLWQLYLFFGICAGFGGGFIYPQLMSYAVQIFPERSGMASGMATAAFGSGAIIWAPITTVLIEKAGLKSGLITIGLIFMVVIFAVSFLLREPPKEFLKMHELPKEESSDEKSKQYTRGEMIKTSDFYLLIVMYVCALTAGMMIISQASPMLQQMLAYTPAKAAVFVSIFSATNMIGRFFWGGMSDKIGIYRTIGIVFIINITAMCLLATGHNQLIVNVAMCLTTSSYGGFASVLTPITAKLFGKRHIKENFGVVYVVFGIASLVGPTLATSFKSAGGGSYYGAFVTSAILGVIGFVLILILSRRAEKQRSL